MRTETFVVDTPDGARLHAFAWLPAGEPRAVVQVSHGMAEHAARYAGLAEDLTAAGYAVVAHDHRGHGRTESEARGHMADANGWDKVANDILRVTGVAKESFPGKPLFLLGHSWGSMLARDYAMRWGHQLAGLVIVGTAGDPGMLGRIGKAVAHTVAVRGRRRPSPLLDKLSFGSFNKAFAPNRTDFDWLSTNEADVDAYIADPDSGFVCSAQFYADLVGGIRRVNNPTNVALVPKDLPVLVLAGAEDPVGDQGAGPRAVAEMLKQAGVSDVECHIYPGMRHEVLRETDRQVVVDDLLTWLDARHDVVG